MQGVGKVLTCSVCGLPLSPEEVRKCRVCGKYVCRDHIGYHPHHGWTCTSCRRKMSEKREQRFLLGVAYVDL